MSVSICALSEIKIADNRIRRDFKPSEIEELANDIERNGLYHPPVLRSNMTLIAGERRVRALKLLVDRKAKFFCDGKTFDMSRDICPYTSLGELSEREALEAELHENLLRRDLSWKEKISARERLHTLRTQEAEGRGSSWSKARTAKELADATGMHRTSAEQAIARAQVIAPYLDDPKLKHVKSEQEAFRIVSRQLEANWTEALSIIERNKDKDLEERHTLIHGDLREISIPTNAFDLIITDPPYGIGADKFGDAAKSTHTYEDTPEYATEISRHVLYEGYNWTYDEAHLFMFTHMDRFQYLYTQAACAGWTPWRTPLIWHHAGAGHIPQGLRQFRREYEIIFYARKGDKPLNKLHSDVFTFPVASQKEGIHAARKPRSLYSYLIKLSCLPGDRVIDPCCGGGTIFPAALEASVEAWGIEVDEDMYKVARIEKEKTEGN